MARGTIPTPPFTHQIPGADCTPGPFKVPPSQPRSQLMGNIAPRPQPPCQSTSRLCPCPPTRSSACCVLPPPALLMTQRTQLGTGQSGHLATCGTLVTCSISGPASWPEVRMCPASHQRSNRGSWGSRPNTRTTDWASQKSLGWTARGLAPSPAPMSPRESQVCLSLSVLIFQRDRNAHLTYRQVGSRQGWEDGGRSCVRPRGVCRLTCDVRGGAAWSLWPGWRQSERALPARRASRTLGEATLHAVKKLPHQGPFQLQPGDRAVGLTHSLLRPV